MPSIKFKYNGETKKILVHKEPILYNDLLVQSKELFPSLSGLGAVIICFVWYDEDGDKMRCNSDKEIEAAISELKTLAFEIELISVSL